MNLLKMLLVALTTMGVLGSVQAKSADQVPNPDTPTPADSGSYFVSGLSTPYSFADMVNLPAGAEQRLLTGDTISRVPGGTLAELSNVAGSTPTHPAGASNPGSLLGAISTLNGAMDDLSAVVVPDEFAASRSGTTGWQTGAGFLFSTTEIPEPADWVTLLCGLVVVAFMARRKSGPFAD